jgi:hypothetical protein
LDTDGHPRERHRLQERLTHFFWVEISKLPRPCNIENQSVKVGVFTSRVLFNESMLLDFHSTAGKFQQSSDTTGRAQTSVCFAASSTRASVPNPPHTSTTEQQFGIMDQNRLLQVVEVSEEFQRLVERAAQEIRPEADSVTIGLPVKKLSTSLSCKAVINEFYRSYIKV